MGCFVVCPHCENSVALCLKWCPTPYFLQMPKYTHFLTSSVHHLDTNLLLFLVGFHTLTGCSAVRFHMRLQNGITPKIALYEVDSVISTGHTAWYTWEITCPCDSVKVISIDSECDWAKRSLIGGFPIVYSLNTRKEEPFQCFSLVELRQ